MKALRELATIIGEQAVAIDFVRRLLQDAVDSRNATEKELHETQKELAELRERLAKLEAAIEEQGQEAVRQMSVAGSGFGEAALDKVVQRLQRVRDLLTDASRTVDAIEWNCTMHEPDQERERELTGELVETVVTIGEAIGCTLFRPTVEEGDTCDA